MRRSGLWLYGSVAVMGAVALYIGGIVLTGEGMISGLCIGLGAAAFCMGIGNFISSLLISKPQADEFARRKAVEVKDERNIRLREKVGSTINKVLVYALSILVLALGFMGAGITVILMVSSLLLLELVLAIGLSNYYTRRM
ncbi:hypothetical protein D3C75_608360 [compost metagenome]